jgi:hypothetical protein
MELGVGEFKKNASRRIRGRNSTGSQQRKKSPAPGACEAEQAIKYP